MECGYSNRGSAQICVGVAAEAIIFIFPKLLILKKEISSLKGFLFSFSGMLPAAGGVLLPPRLEMQNPFTF